MATPILAGSLVFLIERTSYCADKTPVDYEMLHYRGDQIRFVTRLARRPPAGLSCAWSSCSPRSCDKAMQVGCVGSQGRNLALFLDINQPINGVHPLAAQYPTLGTVDQWNTIAYFDYNSLQTSVRQRVWKNLTANVNYAWAHEIDDARTISLNRPIATTWRMRKAPASSTRGTLYPDS